MIEKTLICLNKDLKFLENCIKNDFFKKNPKIVCEFIYDKAAFDGKKRAIENNAYDAIVVLCELTWEGHTFAQLWGIELVQQEICLSPHVFTPVLFVSLFSRAEILQREPHKKIIAAYALGYHFIQLPIATKDDMARFYHMERVGTLEKEDAYHFASRKAMVQAIRHDVKNTSESIEISRQRLLKLLETAAEGYQQRAEEIKAKLGETSLTVKDIIAICNEIEPWFVDEYTHPSSSGEGGSSLKNYKVLFLEDEKNLLNTLKIEAKKQGINILHYTQTSKALKKIERDTSNEIKVVVVDFRIWDKPEDYYGQRMLEPQGYRFIEKVVAMGHYCIFITLSELPRMFQHRISSLSSILIVPENKQLVLSTPEQRANFIQKLHYWAADTEERLKVNAFGSEKLFEFYKWLLMQKEEFEKIDTKTVELKDKFDKIVGEDVGRIDVGKIYEAKNFMNFPIFKNEYKNSKTEWNLNEKPLSDDEYFDNWCKSVINRYNNRENKGNLDEEIKQVLDIEKDNDVKIFHNLIPKRLREKIRYNFSDEQREKIVKIQKGKDKRTIDFEEDKPTFIKKLIIRRFAIYLYYWFEKNNFKDKCITKLNLFLQEGKIPEKATDYPKNPDNRITSKCLFLTHKQGKKQGDKKGKDIKSLQDIALTFEEVIFFRNNVPDLYDKIK